MSDPLSAIDPGQAPAPPDHTPWTLTFLLERPAPGAVDEIAGLLRERSIVGVVADGKALGRPGTVGAIIASDDAGRTLLDIDGRLASGQQIEHLVAGLAYLTGYRILVDDEIVVLPDGAEERPTDELLDAPAVRSLVVWRTTADSAPHVRGLAYGAGVPVSHATSGPWTVVAPPEGYDVDPAGILADRGERPVVTLSRDGATRSLRWRHRERGREVLIEIVESAWPGAPAVNPAPGTDAERLVATLGAVSIRHVPDTGLLSAQVRSSLSSLPHSPDAMLVAASRLLEVPTELATAVENATVQESGHWLTIPGTVHVEPDASLPAMVKGLVTEIARDAVLSSVQGTGRRGGLRRWFWRRPRVLVTFAVVEVVFGLVQSVWAASGGDLWGQNWLLWSVATLWIADGALNLAVGLAALRRRRSPRASR